MNNKNIQKNKYIIRLLLLFIGINSNNNCMKYITSFFNQKTIISTTKNELESNNRLNFTTMSSEERPYSTPVQQQPTSVKWWFSILTNLLPDPKASAESIALKDLEELLDKDSEELLDKDLEELLDKDSPKKEQIVKAFYDYASILFNKKDMERVEIITKELSTSKKQVSPEVREELQKKLEDLKKILEFHEKNKSTFEVEEWMSNIENITKDSKKGSEISLSNNINDPKTIESFIKNLKTYEKKITEFLNKYENKFSNPKNKLTITQSTFQHSSNSLITDTSLTETSFIFNPFLFTCAFFDIPTCGQSERNSCLTTTSLTSNRLVDLPGTIYKSNTSCVVTHDEIIRKNIFYSFYLPLSYPFVPLQPFSITSKEISVYESRQDEIEVEKEVENINTNRPTLGQVMKHIIRQLNYYYCNPCLTNEDICQSRALDLYIMEFFKEYFKNPSGELETLSQSDIIILLAANHQEYRFLQEKIIYLTDGRALTNTDERIIVESQSRNVYETAKGLEKINIFKNLEKINIFKNLEKLEEQRETLLLQLSTLLKNKSLGMSVDSIVSDTSLRLLDDKKDTLDEINPYFFSNERFIQDKIQTLLLDSIDIEFINLLLDKPTEITKNAHKIINKKYPYHLIMELMFLCKKRYQTEIFTNPKKRILQAPLETGFTRRISPTHEQNDMQNILQDPKIGISTVNVPPTFDLITQNLTQRNLTQNIEFLKKEILLPTKQEQRKQDLEMKLKDKDTEIKKLKDQQESMINEQKKEFQIRQATYEEKIKEIKDLKRKNESISEEKTTIYNQLTIKNKKIQELEKEKKNIINEENDKLKKIKKTYKAQIDRLNSEHTRKVGEIQKLNEEYQIKLQEINKQQLNELKTKSKENKDTEIKKLKDQQESMINEQKKEFQIRQATYEEEIKSLNNEQEELKKINQQQLEETNTLSKEKQDLEMKLKDKDTEIEEKDLIITGFQEEIKSLNTNHDMEQEKNIQNCSKMEKIKEEYSSQLVTLENKIKKFNETGPIKYSDSDIQNISYERKNIQEEFNELEENQAIIDTPLKKEKPNIESMLTTEKKSNFYYPSPIKKSTKSNYHDNDNDKMSIASRKTKITGLTRESCISSRSTNSSNYFSSNIQSTSPIIVRTINEDSSYESSTENNNIQIYQLKIKTLEKEKEDSKKQYKVIKYFSLIAAISSVVALYNTPSATK